MVLKNSKNHNLNKFIIKRNNGGKYNIFNSVILHYCPVWQYTVLGIYAGETTIIITKL